jgi:hypothetical protein
MAYQIHRQWFKNPVRFEKVKITYTRNPTTKRGFLDQDNLAASFKPVGDALKELGIIVDDNPREKNPEAFMELKCQQKITGTEGFSLYLEEIIS